MRDDYVDYDSLDHILLGANSGFSNQSTADFDFDEIKEMMRMAKEKVFFPDTPMSKDIVCHPDNLRQLQKHIGTVETDIDNCSFLHQINAYKITTDIHCPKYQITKDSKVIWHDSPFVTYSEGPSSDMCYEDYLSMCLFMGWAEQEGELVFYYLDQLYVWKEAERLTEMDSTGPKYMVGDFKYVYPNPDIDRWNRLNVGEYTGIRYPLVYNATFRTETRRRDYWKTIKKYTKIFLFGRGDSESEEKDKHGYEFNVSGDTDFYYEDGRKDSHNPQGN